MEESIENVRIRGRFLGVFVLSTAQLLLGFIHIFFGLALLFGSYVPMVSSSSTLLIFSSYTVVYGLLTVLFAYLFWVGNRVGWIGTAAVSLFVIVVDILAFFDLFNVFGIIKTAGLGEIPYSIVILVYLLQKHVRIKYNI
jgi:hypothetical protein